MQNATIIGPKSFLSMPWKNGLGHTVELLKQDLPVGNGFAWRLSMADVTTDGSFSNFEGYDRTLVLLEGTGITLEVGHDQRFELTKRLQAAQFDGGDQTFATLHDGAIKDFNVMVSQSHCSANVVTHDESSERMVDVNCNQLLVYAVEDDLVVRSELLKMLRFQHNIC